MIFDIKNLYISLNSLEINVFYNFKRFDNEGSLIEVKEKWYYVCFFVN